MEEQSLSGMKGETLKVKVVEGHRNQEMALQFFKAEICGQKRI